MLTLPEKGDERMELVQFVSVTNGAIMFSYLFQASNVLCIFGTTLFSIPGCPLRWLPAAHPRLTA